MNVEMIRKRRYRVKSLKMGLGIFTLLTEFLFLCLNL